MIYFVEIPLSGQKGLREAITNVTPIVITFVQFVGTFMDERETLSGLNCIEGGQFSATDIINEFLELSLKKRKEYPYRTRNNRLAAIDHFFSRIYGLTMNQST